MDVMVKNIEVDVKFTPNVSVILPTYNRASLLPKSIESVLPQSYLNLELIIVDDGSTDCTADLVNKINDSRISYIRHNQNLGAAAARNTGIKNARGDYLAFQDSDDEWLPDKLEKQIGVISKENYEVGVVYCDMLRIDDSGYIWRWQSPDVTNGNLINENNLNYQVANLSIVTMLIRKECFEKVGLFDERFPRFIDMELCIRLSKQYKFTHIKEALVKYHKTVGISSDPARAIIAEKLLLAKYSEELRNNNSFLASRYRNIARLSRTAGQFSESSRFLMRATAIDPLNIENVILLLSFTGRGLINKFKALFKTRRINK